MHYHIFHKVQIFGAFLRPGNGQLDVSTSAREKDTTGDSRDKKDFHLFLSLSFSLESTIGFELCEDIFINSWMILFLISCIDRVEESFFYIFYYIQDNVRFYFYFPVLFWEILLRNFFGNKFVRIYIDTLFRMYLSFFIILLFEN